MINNNILALIHIEKAAGQTLIRILENNFIYKHCRVAPLKKEHHGVFKWADLNIMLMINPFLKAIAGHSVVPYSDLDQFVPNIRYITMLRDPVERYVSHYQYWVKLLNKQISFDAFLSLDDMKNFQTKKIAGSANLNVAKKMIKEKIFLTGIIEDFDNFLIVLKRKIAEESFNVIYKKKNVSKTNILKKQITENIPKYQERILTNNNLDIELYNYVKHITFQKEKEIWIYNSDIENTIIKQDTTLWFKREVVGRIYRKLYIRPLINIIRYMNGLKVNGSY